MNATAIAATGRGLATAAVDLARYVPMPALIAAGRTILRRTPLAPIAGLLAAGGALWLGWSRMSKQDKPAAAKTTRTRARRKPANGTKTARTTKGKANA